MTTILPDELPIPTSPNLISIFLTFPSQAESQERINVEGLLDTGCLAGDFVARRIVERYNIQPILQFTSKLSACSGLDNTRYDMSKSVIVSVKFFNERLVREECVALHYSVHFFYDFSLSRNDHNRGGVLQFLGSGSSVL